MSRCLITGAAGFIGSHLAEALLEAGHEVVGLDSFIPYYSRTIKERNQEICRSYDSFTFHETDLRYGDLRSIVSDCEAVFHLAAMPGLMKSWSEFQLYSSCNIEGTQRLLDAARDENTPHFIHISTSSVYGREATGAEDAPLEPFSPYGITKLSAEQLCRAYNANFGVPITILRYFSVYGPRQRPDMAYNILISAMLNNEPFTMFGDGEQTRSNTYYTDCVSATLQAFEKKEKALGETFNIGGGEVLSLNQVLRILEDITGRKVNLDTRPARPGDQKHTAANIEKARRILGYNPATRVKEGLVEQVDWHIRMMNELS